MIFDTGSGREVFLKEDGKNSRKWTGSVFLKWSGTVNKVIYNERLNIFLKEC